MKIALLILLVLIVIAVAVAIVARVQFGRSYRGALPALTASQRALAAELRADVEALCAHGPRNETEPQALANAASHIERALRSAGYDVVREAVPEVDAPNLIAEIRGTSNEIVVIGAHYDSVEGSPGADDNASGVAALLALARRLHGTQPRRTIRFVAFVNEEPPSFQTPRMGSWNHARRAHEHHEKIVAMLSLEMLGCYADEAGSQQYPPALRAFYPDRGNFIAFAGNTASRKLMRQCVRAFRDHAQFPSEGAALPEAIPQIGWSDQWSFWQFGWPGVMVTDTALFRNPHYHLPTDMPDTLDYERMARVIEGLHEVVRALAR
ncbi:MAG TPA: M28 family peptidase [Thermoanaerobaculia bacterium]|nr:M28 family peptidase [Thermoanaerobaculia bacterium]